MTTMPVRDFMRGGYKRITEATIVTKHGRPMFTVLPPYVNFTLTSRDSTTTKR